MAVSDVAVGMILSQTVLGILGNSFLLCHLLFPPITGYRLRPTDLFLKHLIFANTLSLLCKAFPQTMVIFDLKVFPRDIECKLTFYFHRVGRSVSMGSTCLLSVFQVITISPRDSRWAELKAKAPRYIGFFVFLSWIQPIFVNVIFLMYMTEKSRNKNATILKDFGYCSSVRHDKTTDIMFAVLLTFPDVVCVGLMLWASSSMVFILHRHKQRMRHIHSTICPRSSPETRATQTILLLVSTFVCFYMLSCIISICSSVIYKPSWVLVHMPPIVSGFFPTISPFLLMSGDSSSLRLCSILIRNRNPRIT